MAASFAGHASRFSLGEHPDDPGLLLPWTDKDVDSPVTLRRPTDNDLVSPAGSAEESSALDPQLSELPTQPIDVRVRAPRSLCDVLIGIEIMELPHRELGCHVSRPFVASGYVAMVVDPPYCTPQIVFPRNLP